MTDSRQAFLRRSGCEHCGDPIPAGKKPNARYCSDACRKRACADRHRGKCVDCSATLSEGAEWRGFERCRPCNFKREAAALQAKLEDVAEMYRSGASVHEITATLGYGAGSYPPEIAECFRRGLLTEADHRYDAQRRENIREGRWGVAA